MLQASSPHYRCGSPRSSATSRRLACWSCCGALFGHLCVSDAAAAIGGHPRGVAIPVDDLNLVRATAYQTEPPSAPALCWIRECSLASLAGAAALLDEAYTVLAVADLSALGGHPLILPRAPNVCTMVVVLEPGDIHQTSNIAGAVARVWPTPWPGLWHIGLTGYPPYTTEEPVPADQVMDWLAARGFTPGEWTSWPGPIHEVNPDLVMVRRSSM